MPSIPHEALVQLFRDAPGLLERVLAEAKLIELPSHDALFPHSESIGDALPRELRCDAVFRFDRQGEAVLAAALEVQLAEDPEKRFTWPAYLVGARLRFRCAAVLVVVAVTRAVTQWARQAIVLGPGVGEVRPLVVGPDDIPTEIDPIVAHEAPELAVLAAIAHGRDEDPERAATRAAVAAGAVLSVLSGERCALYYDLIKASLSDAARKAFEMMPGNYEYQDEGMRRAKAEGVAQGEARGKAQAVVAVLLARGLIVSPDQRKRILASADVEQLERWLLAAVTATSTDALFTQ